jgi:hypothetical protein
MSILVSTINVNQPQLTNYLIDQVSLDTKPDYEIMVLENGSTEANRSKYSTHVSDRNYFYGGALNMIFEYFLEETDHEWLMVLNNDLIIHGYNFITAMVEQAEAADVCMLAPAVINAEMSQCNWKQMHNWLSGGVRYVPWIDFQAPMLRRDIVEIIGSYSSELIYGWGPDFLSGMIAEEHDLKVGVSDSICIAHLNSQTLREGVVDLEGNPLDSVEYCRRAESGMNNFMRNDGRWDKFTQFKEDAANYEWSANE